MEASLFVPKTNKELLKKIEIDSIDYIRCEYCDIQGRAVGKIIPARHFKSFIKSDLPIVNIVWFYTALNTPVGKHTAPWPNVPSTAFPETYSKLIHIKSKKKNIARVMFYPKTFNVEPRQLLLSQILKLKNNFGLEIFSAFEHEYQLIDKITGKSLWNSTPFCQIKPLSKIQDFLFEIDDMLYNMGVNIESINAEYAPGQVETPIKPTFGVRSADNSFILKNYVTELADSKGIKVLFNTDPYCGTKPGACNGAHFNFSLWESIKKDNENNDEKNEDNESKNDENEKINIIYDKNEKDFRGLSKIARYFIGGILKYANELCAIAQPTPNCYRRSNVHSWAPGNASWGFGNRNCLLRVKMSKENSYIEYRNGGGSCNPYLLMSVIIEAGMLGIKNKIDCGKNCQDNPMDVNSAFYSKEKLLPKTFDDALKIFENGVIKNAFSKEFVDNFVETKKVEIQELKDAIKKNKDKLTPQQVEMNIYQNLY